MSTSSEVLFLYNTTNMIDLIVFLNSIVFQLRRYLLTRKKCCIPLHGFHFIFFLAMPGNIEERNDFAVRKLQALDQNINAKVNFM